ncbi:riboflavin synthase [Anaerovorax odorimutans]|uniref:Riboflavin synthase n=1 Tax=Anaerovorax odorimutans TaxID=109327 RepID=A0ABT1RKB7_9FIRM|nr:riboflavin synthase [Anaerovorax odorimutans]MCQ4635627.1 riboflavin synthase [Anaerovorax odorimutans]
MFTGIIEEVGHLLEHGRGSMRIQAKRILEDVHLGDSIAVNGVCLTVTQFDASSFSVDVMAETLRRSSLAGLAKGSRVNLERAMAADGRFGGHIVSGHIDDTGNVTSLKREGNAVWVTIDCDARLRRYIAEKGSIAIDGISLTVAALTSSGFQVSIIPHTGAETTLLEKKAGDTVNLETDIIAKYMERLMQPAGEAPEKSGIDLEFLQKNGF